MASTNSIALLLAIFFIAPLACLADEVKLKGANSCGTSMCHGSAAPKSDTSVLQNEFYTWRDRDRHSKAYTALGSKASKMIARRLKLGDPAKEKLCLSCHTTFKDTEDSKDSKRVMDEGVTCESCHGLSGPWLDHHHEKETTHAQNVELGMRDLFPLDARGRLCLSCHLGSELGEVSHKLLGGGHPRLTFELDTFSFVQPAHWQVDDDYIARKGNYKPIDAWVTSQRLSARGVLSRIRRLGIGGNTLLPEASLFYCASCHRSASLEEDWSVTSGSNSLGELRLNVANLLIVNELLDVISPDLAKKFKTELTAMQSRFPGSAALTHIDRLDALLQTEVRLAFKGMNIDKPLADKLLAQFKSFGARRSDYFFEEAEQILMGIQAIVASKLATRSELGADLDRLFTIMADPESFDSRKLAKAMREIRSTQPGAIEPTPTPTIAVTPKSRPKPRTKR